MTRLMPYEGVKSRAIGPLAHRCATGAWLLPLPLRVTMAPTGLWSCAGCSLFGRCERSILQDELRDLARAAHAGVREETRADPVSGQVEVGNARHLRTRSASVAATTGRGKHTDGLNVRQEDPFHQHIEAIG